MSQPNFGFVTQPNFGSPQSALEARMGEQTPLELVQATSKLLNDVGAAVYFHADTLARGKELGIDGFAFYILGRGGVLGDCEPGTVTSAFGYFHPDVMTKMWNRGREILDPRQAGRELLACGHRIGEATLGGIDPSVLDGFNQAAATWRANVDVAGLTLYAAIDAEPMPDNLSPAAAAFHHAMVLRELRGSVHLLAVVASGLTGAQAHAIKRPDDVAAFGWAEPVEVDDNDRAALDAAEKLTDQLMAPSISALSVEEGEALVAGTEAIADAFDGSNRFANRTDGK